MRHAITFIFPHFWLEVNKQTRSVKILPIDVAQTGHTFEIKTTHQSAFKDINRGLVLPTNNQLLVEIGVVFRGPYGHQGVWNYLGYQVTLHSNALHISALGFPDYIVRLSEMSESKIDVSDKIPRRVALKLHSTAQPLGGEVCELKVSSWQGNSMLALREDEPVEQVFFHSSQDIGYENWVVVESIRESQYRFTYLTHFQGRIFE